MGPRLYFSSCVIIYEVRNSLIVSQPVNLAAMMDGGRKLYYWKRRQSMRCGTKTNASPSACHRFINVMLHLGSLQWTPKFNWKANRQKDFPLLDSLEYARQLVQISKFWVVVLDHYSPKGTIVCCVEGRKNEISFAFFLCWQVKMDGRSVQPKAELFQTARATNPLLLTVLAPIKPFTVKIPGRWVMIGNGLPVTTKAKK